MRLHLHRQLLRVHRAPLSPMGVAVWGGITLLLIVELVFIARMVQLMSE